MKKTVYIAIYIVCFVATVFIYGGYQKKLIVLAFNNEKIIGEITKTEHAYRPKNSYNKIHYTFDYNGEKHSGSINKSTHGLVGIINDFGSLLINRHYRAGQGIQILYNDDLKFSYIKDELLSEILSIAVLVIAIPCIVLILIIGIKLYFVELFQKIKHTFLVYRSKMVFYTQDINYKITESAVVGEAFDYKKIILKHLVDGTVLCYGINQQPRRKQRGMLFW